MSDDDESERDDRGAIEIETDAEWGLPERIGCGLVLAAIALAIAEQPIVAIITTLRGH
jgi:hypothetical protein